MNGEGMGWTVIRAEASHSTRAYLMHSDACVYLPKLITFHLLSCKIFVDEITLKIQWNQFNYFHAQQIVINKNRYGYEFSLNRIQVVFFSKHHTSHRLQVLPDFSL